ncbi:MAG: hypothetical protein RLZZ283_745 [Candidatus Parcubacteria bacterium]|jgi:predicted transcriptional regulator
MLEEELKSLGLTDKESLVYRAVLEVGKATPARLGSITGINRTTVYAIGKELLQKGFIQEDSLKGVTYYYPTPPKELVKITRKERQALIEKELAIEELAKTIQEMPQSKKYAVPRIKFIEGEQKVEEYLYERAGMWLKGKAGDEGIWWGFQDHDFVGFEPYGVWIKWYWKQAPETTELKLLSNDEQVEREMKSATPSRRQIKFWKKGFDFTETHWILGDYSILIMTREKPHYLVEIHDAVNADNMRKLFKNLWEEIK